MRENICREDDCTMCMACANACPKSAIGVGQNRYGYEKILIDAEKCIDCGLCEKVCDRRALVTRNSPIRCYAGQSRDRRKLKQSASGGAFQMLAEIVLENGGVCYGCCGRIENGKYTAEHIRITTLEELPAILNSKYVLSAIGTTFQQVKDDLKRSRLVLFGGTPCQVLGLRAFLNKEYENLILVDVICHGVTSKQIFNDYIKTIEQVNGTEITEYCFRDKEAGWGSNFRYSYKKLGGGKLVRSKHFPKEGGSHEIHYLRGDISRENCFSCEMSNVNRVSDFTFGDYWSIESEHPEFITQKRPALSIRNGINCIMINSEKGLRYISRLQEKMVLYEVELDSITRHNSNLVKPSKRGKEREDVLKQYQSKGYLEIEKRYNNTVGKKMLVYRLKNAVKRYLPDRLRVRMYQIAFLRKMMSGE